MRAHRFVLGSIIAASLFVGSPASALEARETASHNILDVPATWIVERQGERVRAHPPDKSFQVFLAGTVGVPTDVEHADSFLQSKARFIGLLSQLNATAPARKIDWGRFTGFEVFGTARMSNGYDTHLVPAKWFAIVLVDKSDPNKALYAVGAGTPAGYDRDEPGIYAAMHTLRAYTD